MLVRQLGRVEYEPTWRAMQAFTDARTADTTDELWFCEHPPVYTQGLAGKPEHLLLNPREIPVVQSDRGGQITFHGPGQIVVYCLLDLQRRKIGVRELVTRLESAAIDVLKTLGIEALARTDAPGVYVGGAKIAALGLKVRRGRSYHGLSFNVDMDLTPFANINPCGHEGLHVTDCRRLGVDASMVEISALLERALLKNFEKDSTQKFAQ